jgi:hypothetical protein
VHDTRSASGAGSLSGNAAIEILTRASDRFLSRLDGIGADQWGFHPSRGGWSPSEITEHTVFALRSFAGVLRDHLTPLTEPVTLADVEIAYFFYGGDEAPTTGAPTGKWTDIGRARASFRSAADLITAWQAACPDDLRALGFSHPSYGLLDGTQWILFAAAHTARHRAQLVAVQECADYPG